MKKIILGIIIGITLSLSTLTFASSAIKLVMVPEYVGNYKTTDLLIYVAHLKSQEDTKNEPATNPIQYYKYILSTDKTAHSA